MNMIANNPITTKDIYLSRKDFWARCRIH